MSPSTRELVLAAARRLFGERGYAQVTIRAIAAEAGVSPAMVMKVGTSKERLYADAAPPDPEPLDPDWARPDIGRELVRRILRRRDTGTAEPWLHALLATLDAPDPAAARTEFRDHYVAALERRVAPGPDSRERAVLVAGMLLGMAATVRALRLLDDAPVDGLVETYGAMVQSLVDGGTP